MVTAIYPGTFDPITLGHMDVIKGAAKVADELIIAVAKDTPKKPLFTLKKRVSLIEQDIKLLDNEIAHKIKVKAFSGLVVDFAKGNNASLLIRGLRAVSDFEYEFQMAAMNAKLNKDLQTIFIPAADNHHFISSSIVKQVASLGGDISGLVSKNVVKAFIK